MSRRGAERRNLLTRWRGMAAFPLLLAVAACGSQTGAVSGPTSSRYAAAASRPFSYDPPGSSGDPWGPYIREAARRFDVPERWIREVMRQESAGRATATSPVGAMGLMQVMPGTYTELRYKHGLGDDPYHPYDSIMAGTAYIRQMYDLYGSPAFLAAYNAGPRRLEDYLWSGRSMPTETRNYVARIGPRIVDAHPSRRAAPEIYAAAEIPLNIPPGPRRADSATMLALREQREEQRRNSQPTVQVATLPPGPVVRMDPIPDGSTSPVPVQVASLGGPVTRMDPIPDGSTYATFPVPTDAGTVVRMDPIPNPPEEARPEPVLAAPPPPAPGRPEPVLAPPPPSGFARQFADARIPSAAAPRTLGLIGSAQASSLPGNLRAASAPSPGGWAVQVGAFASENLARAAAGQAREQISGSSSRVVVQPVVQGRSTLYRARVTGLSRDTAQTACERLRARGACMALSPDSQG